MPCDRATGGASFKLVMQQSHHVTSVIMCGIRLGYVLNAAANQNQTTSVAAIRYLQQLMAEEVTGSRMEQF